MVTTNDLVTIEKVLRLGNLTDYTVQNISLFIKHDSVQKRFNATSVVNATDTSTGLIRFVDVPLWGDGSYSLYVTSEDTNDLDVSGVKLEKLGTGYIKKITNQSTLAI